MFWNRKKRLLKNLASSFGEMKTEGFDFDLINRYHSERTKHENEQLLSDQVCEDLDFDLFFSFMDRTTSKIGQQFLYSKMKTLNFDANKFANQEHIIAYLEKHPEERLKIQLELQKLNHRQACYVVDLFQEELDGKPSWYFLIPFLALGSFISLVASFFYPNFFLLFLSFFVMNVIVHYSLKRKTNVFINSIPSLLTLGTVAKNISKFEPLKNVENDFKSSLQTFKEIRRKMSFFKLEQKVDSDMEAAYWFLIELCKITFLLEPLLLFKSIEILRFKAREIENVFRFVGEIDSIISIASLRQGMNQYCIPTISKPHARMKFEDIRHPLIIDCIPNDVDFRKSVLLTGSNMSGKTTYIRAIGLNVIAGLTLNTCFATNAEIPKTNLFSAIRIQDDLTIASSYFFREVAEIKNIIDSTVKNEHAIILLDELFKGTNTIERIASAKAVLSFLAKKNCQIFASTHDLELTTLLKDEFELAFFSENIVENNIQFDYKLKLGVPKNGNAIKILELNGFPTEIVEEAKNLSF